MKYGLSEAVFFSLLMGVHLVSASGCQPERAVEPVADKERLDLQPVDWPEIVDPIPGKIPHSGHRLVLEEVVQAPATADNGQLARLNKMAPIPGGNRTFVNDLRGRLYEFTSDGLHVFLDLAVNTPQFMDAPGLGTGFGSFAFHPDYASNGHFYTTHAENPESSAAAHFRLPNGLEPAVRWVVTEWTTTTPDAPGFSGSRRELIRIDMLTQVHGLQDIAFRPGATRSDEDYGLLYLGVGDGGAVIERHAELLQNPRNPWGSIWRIDPLGGDGPTGQYGIPANNPFAVQSSEGYLGEIYAYGFRNPHRFTWLPETGAMLSSCIGQHRVEELNLIEAGANYGWPQREGRFRINYRGDMRPIYALPEDDESLGFTYSLLEIDHDEINAILNGGAYEGQAVTALQGKYLLAGLLHGRVFWVDSAKMTGDAQPLLQELGLRLANGGAEEAELPGNPLLSGNKRVDLRLGHDARQEWYLMTKANGKIFRVLDVE